MSLPVLGSTVNSLKLRPCAGAVAAAGKVMMLLIAAWAAMSLIASCPAQAATAADLRFQPNLEATVRYLQDAQREDGGFAEPGSEPDPDFSAWVALALAAAGINPRDQTTAKQHYAAGHSAYNYLVEHAHEASLTTDFERELLVVDTAGGTPHDFGGVDLASELLARQITQGSQAGAFPHQAGSSEQGINDTIFAILALSPIHEQPVQEAVARASEWLERQQNCDGSWNTLDPREVRPCGGKRRLLAGEAEGEVDMTGAAIEALDAAGRTDGEGQAKAFEFLHEEQVPNGGFSEFPGEHEPNVASTAWVVQAMWSAAVNPETWVTRSGLASEEPLSYLASMQQEDGHIRWEASRELNGMWMTAYVTPAFTGNPLPIPEVPYEPLPLEPPGSGESGNGGVSPRARQRRDLRRWRERRPVVQSSAIRQQGSHSRWCSPAEIAKARQAPHPQAEPRPCTQNTCPDSHYRKRPPPQETQPGKPQRHRRSYADRDRHRRRRTEQRPRGQRASDRNANRRAGPRRSWPARRQGRRKPDIVACDRHRRRPARSRAPGRAG